MAFRITRIKERIRMNQELLITELQVSSLIDHLFGKKALTDDDVERIRAEVTTQDKATRFLRIMRYKSENMNLLFLEKLKDPGFQPHLAEAILKTEVPDEDEDEENQGEPATSTAMRDWSVEAVCSWLESLNLRREIVSCFNEENICGITLANLTETKIQKFCPVAKYGDIDKLLQSRDIKLAECPAKELKTTLGVAREFGSIPCDGEVQSEAYQRFGCRAKASFKYTQNAQLALDVHKPDKLLEPRHWFVGNQKDVALNVKDCFSSGVIPFICACLNERTNGTCHIGVDRDGTIHGIQANSYNFQSILMELIDSCFYKDQVDAVRKCVQSVRLVEVISPSPVPSQSNSDRLYVVEVDVISSYAYCTDEAFFAKIPKQNSKMKETQFGELQVFRFVDGKPQSVSGPDLVKFMANKDKLAKLREKQEESKSSLKEAQQLSQLSEKLERLLCLNNDVYSIFVTSPMPTEQADCDDFINNVQFLKFIEQKVVFDFDNASLPTSSYCNYEKEPAGPIRVLILQSTDEDLKDTPTMNTKEYLNECIEDSTLQPWIFCNGHHPTAKRVMDVHEWKHNRRPDFLKAVEYFHEAIRPEYIAVVFLLFSNDYEVMLSAAEEFCLKFPNTWVLICETKEISHRFKEYLVKIQHIIRDEEEFDQHCVIGMPWLHVNQTILQKLGNISAGQTLLPTSTGGTIEFSKKLLNDLGDLEILSANHLSNSEIALDGNSDKLCTVNTEKQKLFYQGEEVDWWNFWFENHVLRRDILGKLLDSTNTALTSANETGERVSVIAIYHQPGSGGTTTAKNVLWDLKERYRCAVVKTITSDTGDQVSRLFKEGEPSKPKSVLLLLDNVDDIKVRNLKASLEKEAKHLSKDVEDPPSVPFVLLVCIRCSSDSRASPKICHRRHDIEHSLSSRELTWFKGKYEEMEKKWSQDESLDPRVLISFNILRKNFSQTYIKSTVPKLVDLVTDSKERMVLKYVAFLGMYDPDCRRIPASCFDCVMSKAARCSDGTRALLPSDSKWTNRISDSLKVLLNEDNRTVIGLRTKGIKIIHSLISCEVYRQLVPVEIPASEVMLEFLHSEMFNYKDLNYKKLIEIVYSVSIKRLRRMDGEYQSDFSPLIQGIVSDPKQDKERAVEIFKRACHLTQNVFVAQHLVRFYIHVKEWKSAEELAETMTTKNPKQSVLWNTYGHVFRDQLNQILHDKAAMTAKEAEESLDLVVDGLVKFIQEQKVLDCGGSDSVSGLLGQGSIILRYIELLTRIPGLQENELHEFLLNPGCVPQCLTTWSEKSVKSVKLLEKLATKALEELESERFYLQQTDNLLDYENKVHKHDEQIAKTIEGIRNYFGEDSNETPPHISPEQGVFYRRRRIMRLEGDKLTRILEHWRLKDFQKLEDINHLADENMKTQFRNIRDLLSCIGTGIALCMLQPNATSDPLLPLRSRSNELLNLSKATNDTSTPLEAYLFYAILNWPTPARSKDSLDIKELGNVLEKWNVANSLAKNSQMGQEKRQQTKPTKVLFYIGVEKGAERIWLEKPTDKVNLEWFEGVIVNGGQHVRFNIGAPALDNRVEIPTAKFSQKSTWNKSVFFALGFTWSGPIAVNITADDPRLTCGGCGPMSPLIRSPPGFSPMFSPQLLQLPTDFTLPPPRYIPIAPTVKNQPPIQPGYHNYERLDAPPGGLRQFNQSPRAMLDTPQAHGQAFEEIV